MKSRFVRRRIVHFQLGKLADSRRKLCFSTPNPKISSLLCVRPPVGLCFHWLELHKTCLVLDINIDHGRNVERVPLAAGGFFVSLLR